MGVHDAAGDLDHLAQVAHQQHRLDAVVAAQVQRVADEVGAFDLGHGGQAGEFLQEVFAVVAGGHNEIFDTRRPVDPDFHGQGVQQGF